MSTNNEVFADPTSAVPQQHTKLVTISQKDVNLTPSQGSFVQGGGNTEAEPENKRKSKQNELIIVVPGPMPDIDFTKADQTRTDTTTSYVATFNNVKTTDAHLKQLARQRVLLTPPNATYMNTSKTALDLAVTTNRMIPTHALLDLIFDFNKLYNRNISIPELQAFAIAVADQGASELTTVAGRIGDTNYNEIAAFIRQSGYTLRQVCRLFAPIVFDTFVRNGVPPNNWARIGYKFDERFAAFDFFDGIFERGAIQPPGGMLRRPTPGEIRANNFHARSRITEAQRNSYISAAPQVTAVTAQADAFKRAAITYSDP